MQQVVTFAMPHDKLGEDVAAAVVFREGKTASERELRDFCATRLADFKVPRKLVFLDEIPKGATGKLQRIGLAAKLGRWQRREDGDGMRHGSASSARARSAGLIGAKLAAKGEAEVSLVARGPHLNAMRENGLTLIDKSGATTNVRVTATDKPARAWAAGLRGAVA